jgi:hypothetical protein
MRRQRLATGEPEGLPSEDHSALDGLLPLDLQAMQFSNVALAEK